MARIIRCPFCERRHSELWMCAPLLWQGWYSHREMTGEAFPHQRRADAYERLAMRKWTKLMSR